MGVKLDEFGSRFAYGYKTEGIRSFVAKNDGIEATSAFGVWRVMSRSAGRVTPRYYTQNVWKPCPLWSQQAAINLQFAFRYPRQALRLTSESSWCMHDPDRPQARPFCEGGAYAGRMYVRCSMIHKNLVIQEDHSNRAFKDACRWIHCMILKQVAVMNGTACTLHFELVRKSQQLMTTE
jgi:hypothetical protein